MPPTHDSDSPRAGWHSDFNSFRTAAPRVVRARLCDFVRDASPEQIRAWDASIPPLQSEVGEIVDCDSSAPRYTTILEYELPLESRRPDVVLLVDGAVVVLELKGKQEPSRADLDQVAAYARDLRNYHRACEDTPVRAVVVPTRARGDLGCRDGVYVVGPDAIDRLVARWTDPTRPALAASEFLSHDAYRPLPTLIRAARELFEKREVRWIDRARAATEPALATVQRVVLEAAARCERRLVLITGVPGAGKTLVGLQAVHAPFLDALAVDRAGQKPSAPAVFLSGNGPLVEVLQHTLRGAGGDGKAFVRPVREYVRRYSHPRAPVPPEHVLVFDEAQRAFDAERMAHTHKDSPAGCDGRSEPDQFIEFASRIPQWAVVVGLIGSGQEIHVGEEGGLVQWRRAIENAPQPSEWSVVGPPALSTVFAGGASGWEAASELHLDTELRYHGARLLHEFVDGLLDDRPATAVRPLADDLENAGLHLRLTRDLDEGRAYLRERYGEDPDARYGLLASSRDRDLEACGVPNSWTATRSVRLGPWFADGPESALSCRALTSCATEFKVQGLELDAALLGWGTDLRRDEGVWTNVGARAYRRGDPVRDAMQLRRNAYRVLLTRGRDATLVFVPRLAILDETFSHLLDAGFRTLR